MSDRPTTQPNKIEFQCICGTHFCVDARLAGRKGKCITCEASMTIPHASTMEPVGVEQEPAETLKGAGAGKQDVVSIQALCSICQCSVEDGDDVMACPDCRLPFHAECWHENLGCSTYGCPQVSILKKGPDLKISGVPGSDQDPASSQPVWHCAIGHQYYGPISAVELARWVREKRITDSTMVWKSGMSNWLPLSSSPELASIVGGNRPATFPDSSFPWEFVLLAGSAIAFLLGLVTFGITSLAVMITTIVFGAVKFRKATWTSGDCKCAAIVLLAFIVSLAGFATGLSMGV